MFIQLKAKKVSGVLADILLRGDEWSIKIFNLLAKFYLCSICSQNLNECSLARVPKSFAVARMLGFLSVLLEIL